MNMKKGDIFEGKVLKTEFPDCDASLGNTTALCSFYAEEGGVMIGFEA